MTVVDFEAGSGAKSYPERAADMVPAPSDFSFDLLQGSTEQIEPIQFSFGIPEDSPFDDFFGQQRIMPANLDVHKLAILHAHDVRDFVFALPALHALRYAFPHAEMVLLGLEWHQAFLNLRPGPIDRVEVLPLIEGLHEADESSVTNGFHERIDQFQSRMMNEQFDLAIQLHGGGRFANPFIHSLHARFNVGLRENGAPPLDRWVDYSLYQPAVLRYLEVVSLAGADHINLQPGIAVTDYDLREAAHAVPEAAQPLVIIHPGSRDPRRRWSTEKFAAVGDALTWSGARVVIVGMPSERWLADQLQEQMAGEALNVCGELSLSGLLGLLQRATLVVSNDSGPLQLAVAANVPTVGVYWYGNLLISGPATRNRHRTAISWRVNCPECGMNCTRHACGHQTSYVDDVSQEEVTGAALELFRQYQKVDATPGITGQSRVEAGGR